MKVARDVKCVGFRGHRNKALAWSKHARHVITKMEDERVLEYRCEYKNRLAIPRQGKIVCGYCGRLVNKKTLISEEQWQVLRKEMKERRVARRRERRAKRAARLASGKGVTKDG